MSTAAASHRESYSELLLSLSRLELGSKLELDADGRLTRTFRTLELGAKEQNGHRLVVTRKMLEQMAENFEWRASRGYKTPVVVGHPGCGEPSPSKAWERRIEAPAVGWAQSVEVRDDGLYVTVTFNASFSKQLLEGGFEFNSPSFTEKWTDEFGKDRGAVLIDVGILNYPLQEGLGSIMAASSLAGGNDMLDPETKKLLDDILSRLEALESRGGDAGGEEMGSKLDEMGKRLSALENAASGEGEEEEKSELSSLQAEIKSLSAKLNDDVVKLREQLDESSKRTQEAADKAHAAECLRFLSAQIDAGKLAPSELPKDWKDAPAKAFDGLGFVSLAAAEARYAALPENSVVNLAAQKGRAGTTDDHSLSDELWQMSSMRAELIERFDGDEAKARRWYEQRCAALGGGRSSQADED